jgi:hypothetical protein
MRWSINQAAFRVTPRARGQFMRGRAVLGVGEYPDRRQPLGERDRAIFENRPDLDRELPLAVLTAPNLAGGYRLNRCRATVPARARNAVREPQFDRVGVSPVGIGKVGTASTRVALAGLVS